MNINLIYFTCLHLEFKRVNVLKISMYYENERSNSKKSITKFVFFIRRLQFSQRLWFLDLIFVQNHNFAAFK